MNVREHEPLCHHTTLRTGGPARYFIAAKSEAEIGEAVRFACDSDRPLFLLGGGSNVLAGDGGLDGVVIQIASKGLRLQEGSGNRVEVVAEAGEEWDALVAFAVERGLFGLENMSLIPGTVGGAVVGNIGAYGSELRQTLVWAETLDARSGVCRRFAAAECEFGYRRSFFKSPAGRRLIVLRAGFLLHRQGVLNTRYKDLSDYFHARGGVALTLAEVREAVMAIRRRKLPDLSRIGTAGSFFKNPVVSRAQFEALLRRHPDLPGHDEGQGRVKIPLGWIMDKVCGLRGCRRGRVGTHAEQALVIVNEGGTAAEVEALALELARRVKEATALDIEWEVEKMG